jgi:hypothetical protein
MKLRSSASGHRERWSVIPEGTFGHEVRYRPDNNVERSLGAAAFAAETLFFVNFKNLLRDLTVLAILCRRAIMDWRCRGGGRHGNPILCEGSHIYRIQSACRFSIRGGRARNSHQLIHHNGLCLPPESGRLKGKRKPGIQHFVSPVVHCTRCLCQPFGRQ